ncbi:hypothetical protein H5410_004088 [Solanum commersonii]|uniref:C2H2-type domain-containing protein n=1 Tax=Solanum commersonii TaxID=4109 RepID=A0A9J6B6Y7_SOLCO|nr:hypothetical protein H5410_004088 [Solanum commersonii]
MQELNELHGVSKYQCVICSQLFSSSQAIAGHAKIHHKDGWVKGTPQKKITSSRVTDIDPTNYHQLGLSPLPTPPKQRSEAS